MGREPAVEVGLALSGRDAERLERLAIRLGLSRRELARRIVEHYLIGEGWIRAEDFIRNQRELYTLPP